MSNTLSHGFEVEADAVVSSYFGTSRVCAVMTGLATSHEDDIGLKVGKQRGDVGSMDVGREEWGKLKALIVVEG